MNFFRNPEIKKIIAVWLIITAVVFFILFGISAFCAVVASIGSVIMGVSFLVFTKRRYKKLYDYSESLENILNGSMSVRLCDYSEGELSVLNTEIEKIILHFKESKQTLKNDKQKLIDLTADISHQLKTPLTSMGLIADFLREENITAERRIELSKELQQLISHTDTLVYMLLKIAKFDAGAVSFQKSPVPVAEVIKAAVSPLAIPMELKEQTVKINASGGESFVGDLKWSVEAVGNIVKNCAEHTPNGGVISISCTENPMYTELVISDSGDGFAPEDIPHLFERFYKGENASETSIGIGLALAKLIVNEQNGTIKAENARTGGARFTIRFYKGIV